MKFVAEYRDQRAAEKLLKQIQDTANQKWTLMEVCGGQTHGILRYGIDSALNGIVELVHGPGCPVCVTSLTSIDMAQKLSREEDTIVTSFGDMLRVPGSRCSLLDVRGEGGQVRIVYSPLDAVELARQNPAKEVVFFAVGFETTAPATALAVLQAQRDRIDNFSLLVAHVRVQPAMEKLVSAEDNVVQAFLAAGHVCTVAGFRSYESFVQKFQLPVVVTGFEPLDLLNGILACVRQLEAGDAKVENQYARSVEKAGNTSARQLMETVYQIGDREWRGIGTVSDGGLYLREPFKKYDALHRFKCQHSLNVIDQTTCRSADVLSGKIKPTECSAFASQCVPESPLGAPMVSSEGACAAYYRYQFMQKTTSV